jgi:hypothetical protein
VHGNQLTFSRSGGCQKLYCVSTILFPQYTVFNGYFIPKDNELPAHGVITRLLPFDFGFSDPSLVIYPYDTAYFPIELGDNFLAETITGFSDVLGGVDVAAAGALANVPQDPAYLVNFQHTHLGSTRQWANKSVTNDEAVGTGENPLLFKTPVLIPKGDTLTCVVQNMLNAQLRVQVLLAGGSF